MRIAINGFGRIGRLTLRNLILQKNVEIVAINDLTDTATLAHLFEFDSSHGKFAGTVEYDDQHLIINNHKIPTLSVRNPADLPWESMKVDVVLECTGIFRKKEQAALHLSAGAKKVVLSAPAKSAGVPTVVRGVNEASIPADATIVSNASCTTNCLAPLVKVLHDNWGIAHGFMSTTHAYTATQRLQDAPHKDLRRARAAAVNVIPTTTGAAKALALVMPELEGKIYATCIRVPVPTGSLVELMIATEKTATAAAVNQAFEQAANGSLKGILQYTDKPLVSSDIVSNPHSCIFDALLTKVHHGMIKITAWYDNEAGYAARLAEMATQV